MPERGHTAQAAKPTALLPRPVSICRGTKIIGMFLPRWLFRARLTLSAVFFRHFSRPPAAPACFRPISALSPLPASGPLVPARLPLLPASGRFPLSPPLPASGPLVPARLPLLPASACPPLPARHILPISALACTFFLHLLGSFFRRPTFLTFARLFFSLHVLSCAFLRCLLTLTIHRPFPSRDLPPFPPAFSHAFRLRLPRFSFCDSPRLSPALAPLFLLRFPHAFRPQFQRFSSTLLPPFPHEKNGAEAPFFCCLLTPWNR